jgi:hypothetical protein
MAWGEQSQAQRQANMNIAFFDNLTVLFATIHHHDKLIEHGESRRLPSIVAL